jgi:hypothetical protein
MFRSIVVTITFLVVIPQHAGSARTPQQTPDSQSSILQVKSETVRVKLLDALSGEVISNSDVKVSSDNGIRCIKAPCPTDGSQWNGRSDANGYVIIPTNIFRQNTDISTPAYRGGKDLIGGSEQDIDGGWVIELIPNRTFDSSGPYLYRLKLVDAESNRPLINTQVAVSFNEGESFEGKTNLLGYIFFPLREMKGWDEWVVVTGYKRTKINWGWVNYKMKLERQ